MRLSLALLTAAVASFAMTEEEEVTLLEYLTDLPKRNYDYRVHIGQHTRQYLGCDASRENGLEEAHVLKATSVVATDKNLMRCMIDRTPLTDDALFTLTLFQKGRDVQGAGLYCKLQDGNKIYALYHTASDSSALELRAMDGKTLEEAFNRETFLANSYYFPDDGTLRFYPFAFEPQHQRMVGYQEFTEQDGVLHASGDYEPGSMEATQRPNLFWERIR